MTVEFREGLVAFLSASAPSVGGRVHASVLPDKAVLPAVAYQVISNVGALSHDGGVELRNPRVQVDVWAGLPDDAAAIAKAIKVAMVGYRGPMGGLAYTAGWRLEDETDSFEEGTRLYRVSLDFRGWYEEA